MRALSKRVERLAEEAGLPQIEEGERNQVVRAVLEQMTVDELKALRQAVLARDAGEILTHEQLDAFVMWEQRVQAYLAKPTADDVHVIENETLNQ